MARATFPPADNRRRTCRGVQPVLFKQPRALLFLIHTPFEVKDKYRGSKDLPAFASFETPS